MTEKQSVELQTLTPKESLDSDLVAMMKSILRSKKDKETPADIHDLQAAYSRFCARERFVPGELVQWKSNLKNRKLPMYGEPAAVVEFLSTPVVDAEADAGASSFREPLDLVLGVLDADGDFLTYHFDSRRFEKIKK